MYHLRQVFTTIGVVTTMYVAGKYSSDLIYSWMLPDIENATLVAYILDFVLAMIAGMLTMKLLTWRFRLIAMLILPTLIPLFVAMSAWLTMPDYGVEMSYLDALAVARFLFIYPIGMLLGGLLARLALREHSS